MRRQSIGKCLIISVAMFGCILLATGESRAQKAAPYPVGAVFDLTGIISSIGGPEKRGLEIAVEAVNTAGGVNGRQLKMTVYDSESNATKGVTETKRLIDVDKVIAGLGYSSTGVSMAAIQTVESGKIVMLSAGASEKIWIPTNKWVFNVVPRQREASIPMLLDVLQQRGAKKIAYINIDNTFGQTGREVFDWAVKEMKIIPAIIEKYAVGSTDVGPQMTHIKAAGADGLLITGQMADTVMVIKNARDQGFTGPIVADYSIVGPEFIDLAGKYGEGIVTTSIKTLVAPDLPDNDPQKKVAMDLYNKYTKQYGAFSLYAGHGWDEVYLLVTALKKVDPKLDPAKDADLVKIRAQVRDNLETIKGFVGQNGIFNYSPENHNGLGPKCYVPVVVENGKWRLYKGK
ncbi:MAG TPA: ABC transporter substrate-binding protein [Syntrophorhabdales bacterium]|nr:ABC transporter substrate-binding protein [Syntrophorhabdales bacterium]